MSIRLWSSSTGSELSRLDLVGTANCLAFRPNSSEILAAGMANGLVEIWQTNNGKLLQRSQRFDVGRASITAVAWSPDGEQLASAGNDATVKIWQVNRKVPPTSKEMEDPIAIRYPGPEVDLQDAKVAWLHEAASASLDSMAKARLSASSRTGRLAAFVKGYELSMSPRSGCTVC